MIKIKFPEENFFQDLINQGKKLKEKIDKEWNKCDNGEKDCNQIYSNIKELEEGFYDLISLNAISKIFDSIFDRKDNQLYDISKIYISNENYEKMTEHDKEILMLMHDFTKEGLDREVGMLHFMQGFTIKDDIDNKYILIEDNPFVNTLS